MTATVSEIARQIETGRYDEAGKALRGADENSEHRVELQFLQGYLRERSLDREGALATYEALLDEDPDHEQATFRAALLHDLGGNAATAIDLYQRCVERRPARVNALLNLAVLYEEQGRYQEAERFLTAILREHPDHERANRYLTSVKSSHDMMYDESRARERDMRDAVLDLPICDFELSVRSRNCLRQMNIRTLGDLLRISELELLSYKNFGETSLCEIKAMLAQKGLKLGQALQPAPEQLPQPVPDGENGDVVPITNVSVSELELSVRARKCLQRLGVTTIDELAMRSEAELMASKNFGDTSLAEIKRQLAVQGRSLRQ